MITTDPSCSRCPCPGEKIATTNLQIGRAAFQVYTRLGHPMSLHRHRAGPLKHRLEWRYVIRLGRPPLHGLGRIEKMINQRVEPLHIL